eukprot:2517108-Amphidinium_carterae.2
MVTPTTEYFLGANLQGGLSDVGSGQNWTSARKGDTGSGLLTSGEQRSLQGTFCNTEVHVLGSARPDGVEPDAVAGAVSSHVKWQQRQQVSSCAKAGHIAKYSDFAVSSQTRNH